MKKFKLLIIAVVVFSFLGCEPILLKKEVIPELKVPAGKALVVILRKISVSIGNLGGGGIVMVYLDNKFVTGTEPNTVTTIEVDPGEHFIVSKTDMKTPLKFDFKEGKVYYILQATFPVPFIGTGNKIVPLDGAEGEENLKSMRDDNCEYAYANPASPQDDLSDKDYRSIKKEWEKLEEKDPEEAKKSMGYPGY